MAVTARRAPVNLWRETVIVGLFCLLSVAMTWPLAARISSAVLGPPGDNLEYVWKMWWFKTSIMDHGASPLFAPDVFYPFGYPLALSETTVTHTLAGVPLTALFGEVASYNLVMLGTFVLSGYATYRVAGKLGARQLAAIIAGVAFAFCPYRMAHLGAGHLPLMGTGFIPLLFLSLDAMVANPSWRRGLAVGSCYAATALSSWYYAVMVGSLAVLFVFIRAWPWKSILWRSGALKGWLLAAGVVLVLLAPVAFPMAQLYLRGEARYDYSLAHIDRWSASPVDLILPTAMHPLWGASVTDAWGQNIHEHMISLGWVALVLAIVGGWRRRDEPFVRGIAWVGIVAGILALGSTLHWRGQPVYVRVPDSVEQVFARAMYTLTGKLALNPVSFAPLRRSGAVVVPLPGLLAYLWLPSMDAVRVWARFAVLTQVTVAILAGLGAEALLGRFTSSGVVHILGDMVGVFLLLLVLFERLATPYPYGYTLTAEQPVDTWLSQQRRSPIIQFPLARTWYGWALAAQRQHGQPMAYGYGTFVPAPYRQATKTLDRWPDADAMALLEDWGVHYILVGERSHGLRWPAIRERLNKNPDLVFVGTFEEEHRFRGDHLLSFLSPDPAVPATEVVYGPLQAHLTDTIHVYRFR